MNKIVITAVVAALLPAEAFAFKDKAFLAGVGYFSQNFMNETTQSNTGASSFLGEPSYPLNFRYESLLSLNTFVGAQLSYTLLPRTTPGNTSKVTMTHLVFNFGNNFQTPALAGWDWSLGPGLIRYEIKGTGGTKTLNNGGGTAVFAVPGGSSTVQKVTVNMGVSRLFTRSRIGFDIIFEDFFSSSSRTQSLMLSYAYQFGGVL